MTDEYSVLISTSSFGVHDRAPLDRLDAANLRVVLNPNGRKLSEAEIGEMLGGIDGLIAGTEPLSRAVVEAAPRLRVISRCGTGLDNVDLDAAAEREIRVFNTPDAHVDAVAELVLGGLLDLLRHISAADRGVRAGGWGRPMGRLLRGMTVGIIGLGRVGKRLAELLAPFEVRILAHDPRREDDFASQHSIEYLDLDGALQAADAVTLHVPYSPENRHIIDAAAFARMKPGAVLVNAGRGGLVDESALRVALEDGRLAGAFLDTFEEEPYTGPLRELDNVVLTPHIGSYAAESRVRMELEAVENLLAGLGLEGR